MKEVEKNEIKRLSDRLDAIRHQQADLSLVEAADKYAELEKEKETLEAEIARLREVHSQKLSKEAQYPIEHTFITYGALNEHILDVCRKHAVDLVIYGNHNQSFFSRASCSAKSVVGASQVDVLLVPLAGD